MDDIMSKEKRCDGIPSSPELEQGTPISEVTLMFYSIMFSEEEKQSIDIVFFFFMTDPPTRQGSPKTRPQGYAGHDEETIRRHSLILDLGASSTRGCPG